MQYFKGTLDFRIPEASAVSLGKFDGLHRGHKYLLQELEKGKLKGYKSVIFTFDVPPASFFQKDYKVLSTNEEKEQIFEAAGIDAVVECPFTDSLRRMEPYEFLQMLTDRICVRQIAAGKDFRFGKNRSGGFEDLKKYEKEFGYEAVIVDKMQHEGRDISSTRIRELICAGRMEEANYLLGYDYFLTGVVEHGNRIGRTLGFPTTNQELPSEKLLPPNGVYVSKILIDGVWHGGVTNIGCKPTIEGNYPVGVETFIYDFHEKIYGKTVRTALLHFLRPERKFDSVEKLKEQIERDRGEGIKYLEGMRG